MATKKYYIDLDVRGSIDVKTVQLNSNETDITTNLLVVVAAVPFAAFDAMIVDYVIKQGTTNLRAGTVHAVHNSSIIEFVDTSTHDIGDTSTILFDMRFNGSDLELTLEHADGYYVNTFIRCI